MSRHIADIVVLGLGAMGSATLFQLASRGADVLGIDQFSPPHEFGSSHGETRVTRLGVAEGPTLAPLVKRSHETGRSWRPAPARACSGRSVSSPYRAKLRGRAQPIMSSVRSLLPGAAARGTS